MNIRNVLSITAFLGVIIVVNSCSDTSTNFTPDDDPVVTESSFGSANKPLEQLPGDDDEIVTNAVFDLSAPSEATEENLSVIEVDGIEHQIIRTEIEVIISSGATTGELNELLEKYDAKIVDMSEGKDFLILQVPDPGNNDALFNLIERIEDEEIVQYALESAVIEKINLENSEQKLKVPGHLADNKLYKIRNHLSIRSHAAWNLQSLIKNSSKRPWLVVVDWFGDGAPGVGFNVDVEEGDFENKDPDSHGYWVLGIFSGNHVYQSSLSDNANDVTGLYPEQLKVSVQDMTSERFTTYNRRMNRIIKQIKDILSSDPNANIILNTSWGSPSRNNESLAYNWIGKVRGNSEAENLEDNFIHFTAAGNYKTKYGRYTAKNNSPFSFAALESPEFFGFKRDKLSNIFVVENRVPNISEMGILRPTPGCAHDESIMGGNLSAIGSSVYSFENSLDGTLTETGTSASAPQAASVAALVWAIDPSLTVNEVKDIIIKTSNALPITSTDYFSCNSVVPQPVVDAYAAMLAAGGDIARTTLLDINEDGSFDEGDIEVFLNEFEEKGGELDYSRYDLNGSGQTGGNSKEQFDLNGDIQFGTASQTIEGNEIEFSEDELTDNEILCYYSYSNLYDGDEQSRNELLEGICYESISTPVVNTSEVDNITTNNARAGGEVVDNGNASVTARGVCWSTSQVPDITDNCTTDGSGIGSFTSNLTGLSPDTEYYVRAYATNNQGTGYGQERNFITESGSNDWPRDTTTEIVDVTNPATGQTWMDRNLGASRAATSMTDEEAYGDLYQWGRPADGHQKRNSGTTSTLSSTDQPGHGDFILAPYNPYDWRSPQNDNLWQGGNGVNNPCPEGYRLPTKAEWNAERQSWSSNNRNGAFASPLKLPVAGNRNFSSGSLNDVGSFGLYWSHSVSGTYSQFLRFYSSSAFMLSYPRAYGFSVRCIKD